MKTDLLAPPHVTMTPVIKDEPFTVYVELNLSDSEKERIQALADGCRVWFAHPNCRSQEDEHALRTARVIFGNCAKEGILKNPHVHWVQFPSVGVDYYKSIDWQALGGRVTCTNLNGVFANPCAQTALAGILALYRGIDQLTCLQRERQWKKLEVRKTLRTLDRARVILLGSGTIARRLKELLQPFRCHVTTYSKSSGDITALHELDALLPEADIVCSILPETSGTRNLISAARLSRFGRGAYFVNVGRGSVVDEAALCAALHSGALGGAVLDVTQQEPLPHDSPLWSCPNTILTQHTGGGSSLENMHVIDVFEHNFRLFRAGKPLSNIVDWSRGY